MDQTTSPSRGAGHRRRIAVIGAGISGMSAAHELAKDHHVVLFETEQRLAVTRARG